MRNRCLFVCNIDIIHLRCFLLQFTQTESGNIREGHTVSVNDTGMLRWNLMPMKYEQWAGTVERLLEFAHRHKVILVNTLLSS